MVVSDGKHRSDPSTAKRRYPRNVIVGIADATNSLNAGCKYKFEVLKSGFVVVFYRTIEAEDDSLGGITQVTTQATTQATTQDKILEFCAEARSKAEIAEHCGYRSIKHFTDKFLKPMLASGQLLMTIPDKPTSPEQRYVAAGRNAGEKQ